MTTDDQTVVLLVALLAVVGGWILFGVGVGMLLRVLRAIEQRTGWRWL
jgi:hypothetical protein